MNLKNMRLLLLLTAAILIDGVTSTGESAEGGDEELYGANLLEIGLSKQMMLSYMDIMRHISLWNIQWHTDLELIEEANSQQIESLMEEKALYPEVVAALKRMDSNKDTNYFRVIVDNHATESYSHIILAHKQNPNGTRKVLVLEYKQIVSVNWIGFFVAVGTVSSTFLISPPAAAVIGKCLLLKVAHDYGMSQIDVATAAAIRELVNAGLLVMTDGKLHLPGK